MKKILITGGAGFVGAHLVKKLIKQKYAVTIFDNFSINNEEEFVQEKNIEIIKGDIRNPTDLKKALQGVDCIVHLAAIVSVQVCEECPELCHENNIIGTNNVFEIAKEIGIKKIIYASSAAVYGNLSSSGIKEADPTHPISKYGYSKHENELTAHSFSNSINSIGLRFFNIYGPGLNMENAYPSVLVSFFKNILKNKPITVFGDGEQTRDFVHVFDIVQAIIKAIESNQKGAHVQNVGTGIETSILQLAQEIQKIRPEVQINFEEERNFDIKKSCADISKIKKDLNFIPQYKVLDDLEGLAEVYLPK